MYITSFTHVTQWMMKFKPTRPKGEEITPPPKKKKINLDLLVQALRPLLTSTYRHFIGVMFKLGWLKGREDILLTMILHTDFFTLTFDPEN